jgi:hypothetical protein
VITITLPVVNFVFLRICRDARSPARSSDLLDSFAWFGRDPIEYLLFILEVNAPEVGPGHDGWFPLRAMA